MSLRSKYAHRDALQTIQEDQREYRERLEGSEDGEGGGGGAKAQLPPPSPRSVVEYKDLFRQEEIVPVRTIALTSTVAADVPSQRVVWEAVKTAAQAEVAKVEALGSSQTAPCNTAVKFTVHDVSLTLFGSLDDALRVLADEFVEGYCGLSDDPLSFFEEIGSGKRFGRVFKGPAGIWVKADSKVGGDYVSIELKGESFELYGMAPFARLMQRFNEMQLRWHLTRIDFAFDGVPFTPDMVFKAIGKGHVRSLAERKTLRQENTPFGEKAGKTTYFGRRGSADLLRVYDMRATGTRIEHECRKARAKWIGLILMSAPLESWHYVALGELRDFLDFVRRKVTDNVTRIGSKLLPWWAKFVGDVERSQVKMSDVLKGFKQQAEVTAGRVAAAAKNISRRVNALREVLGDQGFLALFDRFKVRENGADRVRGREWREVLTRAADLWEKSVEDIIATAAGLHLVPSWRAAG